MEFKHLLPFLAVVITFLAVNLPISSARRRTSPTVPPLAFHDDDDASGDYRGMNRPGYDDDEGSTDGEREDYSGDHISTRVPDISFHDKSTRPRTTTSIYSVLTDEDIDSAKGENVKIEALKVLITHPAVLAAIIIGGVLTILFIVLLVMFIIYRMRKKDEGSYVLDDPKVAMINHQQPQQTSALIYTTNPSNDQEFYA